MINKVDWVLLTYNRAAELKKSLEHNMKTLGVDKSRVNLIHVDNGSSDGKAAGIVSKFKPKAQVLFDKNMGVAMGYNTAFSLCRSPWIVMTGGDCLMPKNWLKTFIYIAENKKDAACLTMYCHDMAKFPDRVRGKEEKYKKYKIQQGMAIGRKFFSRDLLERVGFLREDLPLYGWEDALWAHRFDVVGKEYGFKSYNINGQKVEQLNVSGPGGKDFKNPQHFAAWKREQVGSPQAKSVLDWCWKNAHPFFSPWVSYNGPFAEELES